jgi:hypothetical protein
MMVSISIFTLAILASMMSMAKGISDTEYVKKKIISTYLAQEGIEYIRNMRDTYMLYSGDTQTGWNSFKSKLITASCDQNNGCYFDDQNLDYNNNNMPLTQIQVLSCGSSCPNLLYNSTTSRYNYVTGGTSSGYIRKIKIQQLNSDEVVISSTVFWTQVSGTYSVTFSENLYNWIE